MIKVPEYCLICGSKWKGGSQLPNKPFRDIGQRVFYECGASMSIKESDVKKVNVPPYFYQILFKGCMYDSGKLIYTSKGSKEE